MDCSPPGSSVHGTRQEYWCALPFTSPGDLPDSGIEPSLLHWEVDSLPLSHQGIYSVQGLRVIMMNKVQMVSALSAFMD